MIPVAAPSEYALASTETDLVRRCAHIRFAPVVAGKPDPNSPNVQHVTLLDLPVPEEIPAPPDTPPEAPTSADLLALPADQRDGLLDSHAKASAAWIERRAESVRSRDKRSEALAAQDFTAWLTDPRPDYLKAEDHYRKVMARVAPAT